MTDPSTIETELRSVLAVQRPPGGAPPELRARVDGIPERAGRAHPLIALFRRAGVPLAAVGIAGAAIVLASIGLSRAPVIGLPPGGGVPPAVTFDPTLEGFGLVTPIIPTLLVAQWVLAAIAIAFAVPHVGAFRASAGQRTRRSKLFGLTWILIALLVAPTTKLAPLEGLGLQSGSVSAVFAGYSLEEPPQRPFNEYDRYYQAAAPGEPIEIMFSVRNAGPVPIRIEGVVVHPNSGTLAQAHWTAVWLQPASTPDDTIVPIEQAMPFEPTTIGPGEELPVFLVGRAGPCAYGPAFTLESDVAGFTQLGPLIEVAYSLAGMVGTTTIDIDQAFLEPHRVACEPG